MREYYHYREDDPAFDKDHEDWNYDAWRETAEESHLPRKEGQTPVRFKCVRLSRIQRSKILCDIDRHGPDMGITWAVSMALASIEDCNEVVEFDERTQLQGFGLMSDEDYDNLEAKYGKAVLIELFITIKERSWPSPRD